MEIFLLSLICLCYIKRKRQESALLKQSEQSKDSSDSNLPFSFTEDQKPPTFAHKQLYNFAQEKLEEYLRFYSHLFRAGYILRKCVQFQNHSAIAVIYETNRLWMDALCCRLRQVKATYDLYLKRSQKGLTDSEQTKLGIFS